MRQWGLNQPDFHNKLADSDQSLQPDIFLSFEQFLCLWECSEHGWAHTASLLLVQQGHSDVVYLPPHLKKINQMKIQYTWATCMMQW